MSDGKPDGHDAVGTWYQHEVPVPDGTTFKTGPERDASLLADSTDDGSTTGRMRRVIGASLAAKDPAAFAIGKTIQVGRI